MNFPLCNNILEIFSETKEIFQEHSLDGFVQLRFFSLTGNPIWLPPQDIQLSTMFISKPQRILKNLLLISGYSKHTTIICNINLYMVFYDDVGGHLLS
jgi:hypothetical protein